MTLRLPAWMQPRRWLGRRVRPKIALPIAPYRFGYTLEYFRSEPGRVDEMRQLLRSSLFQAAMSVLQHEMPLDSIEAVRGHRRVLRLLELMAEHVPKSGAEVPTTYGAHEEFPELLRDEEQPQPN